MINTKLLLDQTNTDVFSILTEASLRSSRPYTAEKERVTLPKESISERTKEDKYWKMQKLAQRSYTRGYTGL